MFCRFRTNELDFQLSPKSLLVSHNCKYNFHTQCTHCESAVADVGLFGPIHDPEMRCDQVHLWSIAGCWSRKQLLLLTNKNVLNILLISKSCTHLLHMGDAFRFSQAVLFPACHKIMFCHAEFISYPSVALLSNALSLPQGTIGPLLSIT